jgi:hypothetical protein
LKHYVVLEPSLGRAVHLHIRATAETHNSIALLETLHILAHLNDFAGNVHSKNERIVEMCIHNISLLLNQPINGIDGYSMVFDDDTIFWRLSVGRGPDVQREGFLGRLICRFVNRLAGTHGRRCDERSLETGDSELKTLRRVWEVKMMKGELVGVLKTRN